MGETLENIGRFRIIQLESEISIHLYFKKYREALSVLCNLVHLLSNRDIVEKVYFMVLESECHLCLDEDSAASMVTQNIVEILSTSTIPPRDVIKMAESHKDDRRYIPAYILYYAACKLYLTESANEPSSEIKLIFDEMTKLAKDMVENDEYKNVVARHLTPAIRKLIEELVSMPDNNCSEKIEQRAWCFFNVGKCYYYLEDSHQFLAMNEAGVHFLKRKLGDDAEKYRVTGHCYNNAGYASSSLGYKEKAASLYVLAISIYENATNNTDTNIRFEDVARARKNLEDIKGERDLAR